MAERRAGTGLMTSPDLSACRWCGAIHGPVCHYVKAMEFYADGTTIKRIEFLTSADFRPTRQKQDALPEPDYPKLGQG